MRPNLGGLGLPDALGTNCFAGSGTRWKTRMFGLGGIPEDPATGSAAGPLAVHLARHGKIGWGEEIEISQGAEIGRLSTLHARADGSAEQVERVEGRRCGSDDSRQRELETGRLDLGVARPEHDLVLEIDLVDAVDRPNKRSHHRLR